MSKITMIPAGKEIKLSQEIYYYMLMQVPQGRLTRTVIFENTLMSFTGLHILILVSLPHYERCRGIMSI